VAAASAPTSAHTNLNELDQLSDLKDLDRLLNVVKASSDAASGSIAIGEAHSRTENQATAGQQSKLEEHGQGAGTKRKYAADHAMHAEGSMPGAVDMPPHDSAHGNEGSAGIQRGAVHPVVREVSIDSDSDSESSHSSLTSSEQDRKEDTGAVADLTAHDAATVAAIGLDAGNNGDEPNPSLP